MTRDEHRIRLLRIVKNEEDAMPNDADWTDTAAGYYEPNDRRGQREYNKYAEAVQKHGNGSPQAREALGKAIKAGWSFSGIGPSGTGTANPPGRGGRRSGGGGGRRSGDRGGGGLQGPKSPPVDQ